MTRKGAQQPRYTKKKMAEALRAANGGMYLASVKLDCAYNTVRRWVERHPDLQEIVREQSEKMVDWAESRLFEAVLRGDPWAITLVLKTKGKNRGYVERTEQQIDVALRREAEDFAHRYGLDPADIVARAEQILAEARYE